MLNLNNLFNEFNDKISLTKTYKNKIKTGRDSLRKKISDNFSENNRNKPKYCMQGSYAMKTTIMPLDEREFDLDNGVYLQGYDEVSKESWPAPTTVHSWIIDAVDGHTKTPPIDKNTCVRVMYEEKYHIDLPIYIISTDDDNNEIAYLAHKKNGWIISDPKAFTAWFQDYVNEHGEIVRRLVKYIKAWKDFKNANIKGIVITILVCENISITNDRDDKSLLDTVVNIIDRLDDNFSCCKPVTPINEDLLSEYSETAKNTLLNSLKDLKNKLDKAINETENERDATDILKKLFGDRFPNGEDENKDISDSTEKPVDLGKEDRHFA